MWWTGKVRLCDGPKVRLCDGPKVVVVVDTYV